MEKNTGQKTTAQKTTGQKITAQEIAAQKGAIGIEPACLSSSASELDPLVAASLGEQYDFIKRLQTEWCSGLNRFDKKGEVIFAATHTGVIVGVCGINQDPYTNDRAVGRLRHLYVDPRYRNHRIGYRLVAACTEFARPVFTKLRLRMARADTAEFYRTSGFAVADSTDATHEMWL